MIEEDEYDFDKALKIAVFKIRKSIVEHEKAEAPTSVIAELKEAHDHIMKAIEILNRSDD